MSKWNIEKTVRDGTTITVGCMADNPKIKFFRIGDIKVTRTDLERRIGPETVMSLVRKVEGVKSEPAPKARAKSPAISNDKKLKLSDVFIRRAKWSGNWAVCEALGMAGGKNVVLKFGADGDGRSFWVINGERGRKSDALKVATKEVVSRMEGEAGCAADSA